MRYAGLLICAVAVVAAEPVVRELDVAIETTPAAFDYTLETQATGRSGSDRLTDPLAVRVGVRWSTGRPGSDWAWVLGADIAAEQAGLAASGSWSATTASAAGGLAWQPDDAWAVVGEVAAGLGQSELSIDGSGFGAQRFTGTTQTTAVRAQVRWLPTRSWVLFTGAGWQRDSASLEGDGATLALTRSGPVLGIGLGWRWSYAPPGLE